MGEVFAVHFAGRINIAFTPADFQLIRDEVSRASIFTEATDQEMDFLREHHRGRGRDRSGIRAIRAEVSRLSGHLLVLEDAKKTIRDLRSTGGNQIRLARQNAVRRIEDTIFTTTGIIMAFEGLIAASTVCRKLFCYLTNEVVWS